MGEKNCEFGFYSILPVSLFFAVWNFHQAILAGQLSTTMGSTIEK